MHPKYRVLSGQPRRFGWREVGGDTNMGIFCEAASECLIQSILARDRVITACLARRWIGSRSRCYAQGELPAHGGGKDGESTSAPYCGPAPLGPSSGYIIVDCVRRDCVSYTDPDVHTA